MDVSGGICIGLSCDTAVMWKLAFVSVAEQLLLLLHSISCRKQIHNRTYRAWAKLNDAIGFFVLLHCALAAAQCIVIGPVCFFVAGCVCLYVGGSVTTITRNCVHRSSPNWVLGEGSDRLQLNKFCSPALPGNGSAAGRKFLVPPYYSQRAVFASL